MCVYIVAALVYLSFALMRVIEWLPKHWQIYFETMASDKDKTRNDLLPSHSGLYRTKKECVVSNNDWNGVVLTTQENCFMLTQLGYIPL